MAQFVEIKSADQTSAFINLSHIVRVERTDPAGRLQIFMADQASVVVQTTFEQFANVLRQVGSIALLETD